MNKLLKSNYHFVWLVIFFILHGLNEFGRNISLQSTLTFFFSLSFAGWVLFIGYKYFTSNKVKAGLFATVLLMVYVFFGAIQDFISSYKFSAKFATLPNLLPIVFCFLVFFFLFLRIKKTIPLSFVRYTNLLFLLLIFIEVAQAIISGIVLPIERSGLAVGLKNCNSCKKPSVYLVILDEYAGKHTLQEFFNFDNSFFYRELSKKGFHIVDSSISNYHRTPLSMASMLNMDYVGTRKGLLENEHYSTRKAVKEIEANPVTDFFSKQGYEIKNYSFFDLKDATAMVQNDWWGGNARFFINQTFYGRVHKSVPFFLARKKISSFFIEQVANKFINGIDKSLMESVESEKQNNSISAKPVFTYIHLNMPHGPYFKDSMGNRIPEKVRQAYTRKEHQAAYLQYLVYANKRILKWIDEIQTASKGKAVILLMSDHGTAPVINGVYADRNLDNLNAVYIPSADYSKWYKGFSNVNQFRLVLNELFQQNLELKPDIIP